MNKIHVFWTILSSLLPKTFYNPPPNEVSHTHPTEIFTIAYMSCLPIYTYNFNREDSLLD